jgi:catechol-2,3-dioxygenase
MTKRRKVMTMTVRPKALIETVLYVDDLEAAAEFYASLLKLPIVHSDTRMRVLEVTDQNFLLLFKIGGTREPVEVPGGTIPPHDGVSGMHVAFSVDKGDAENWAHRLQDNNIAIESKVKWPSGDISLYFRDPAGNLVELVTPDLWRDG